MTPTFTPLLPPENADTSPQADEPHPAAHHNEGFNPNEFGRNRENGNGHGGAAVAPSRPLVPPIVPQSIPVEAVPQPPVITPPATPHPAIQPTPPTLANSVAPAPAPVRQPVAPEFPNPEPVPDPPVQAEPALRPVDRAVMRPAAAAALSPDRLTFSPVTFIRDHFLYLALCAVVSVAIAGLAAVQFTSYSYDFESQLLYHRFGSEELGFVSPNLTALTPLTFSRRVLDPAIENLASKLDTTKIDATDLETALELEVPFESSLLRVELNWKSEDEAAAVLDSVVQEFLRIVSKARQDSIQQTMKGVQGILNRIESRIDEQRHSLQEFNNRYQVLNLDTELNALGIEVDLLEDRLSTTSRLLEGDQAKLAALTQSAPDSGNESQAKNARKSMRMEEYRVQKGLLSDEEERIRQQAELDYQQRLFDVDKELFEKKLITREAFDASRYKLETLKAMKHPSLSSMRQDVDTAEEEIKQMLKNGDASQFILASGTSLKATVEMNIISGEVETKRLAELLEQKRKRVDELAVNRMESQAFHEELKTLSAERVRFQQRMIDLQNLDVNQPIDFTVVESAGPALYSKKSNRKKLALAAFGGCLALLAGPLLLRELMKTHNAVTA